MPEGAVVDVEHALPRHIVRIEPVRVPVVDVVVHHGRQEVVGRRNRVQISRQVQIQALERDHLAVPAARRTALDPEGRPHGWLPNGDGGLPPDAGQGLPDPDRRRGLALPEWRGGHGRDDDVAGPRSISQGLHGVEADFGDIAAIGLEKPGLDAHLCGDVGHGAQRGLSRDFDSRGKRHRQRSCQTDRKARRPRVLAGRGRSGLPSG